MTKILASGAKALRYFEGVTARVKLVPFPTGTTSTFSRG